MIINYVIMLLITKFLTHLTKTIM